MQVLDNLPLHYRHGVDTVSTYRDIDWYRRRDITSTQTKNKTKTKDPKAKWFLIGQIVQANCQVWEQSNL